jgi:hypothetical protein
LSFFSSIRTGRTSRLAAGVGLVASLVAAGVLSTGVANASSSFTIKKIIPKHSHVVTNGPHKNLKIDWTGMASFPITAHYAPRPGCSHDGVTCVSESHTFKTGTHSLVWKGPAYCAGSVPNGWTGHFKVYLVDAQGTKTPNVSWALTCQS